MPRKPSRTTRSGSRKRPASSGRLVRMPPRLRLLKRQHTLVYGLRLLKDQVLEEGPHQQVPLPQAGAGETLTLHQISGDTDEIRQKLHESIDAYFEIFAETEE